MDNEYFSNEVLFDDPISLQEFDVNEVINNVTRFASNAYYSYLEMNGEDRENPNSKPILLDVEIIEENDLAVGYKSLLIVGTDAPYDDCVNLELYPVGFGYWFNLNLGWCDLIFPEPAPCAVDALDIWEYSMNSIDVKDVNLQNGIADVYIYTFDRSILVSTTYLTDNVIEVPNEDIFINPDEKLYGHEIDVIDPPFGDGFQNCYKDKWTYTHWTDLCPDEDLCVEADLINFHYEMIRDGIRAQLGSNEVFVAYENGWRQATPDVVPAFTRFHHLAYAIVGKRKRLEPTAAELIHSDLVPELLP